MSDPSGALLIWAGLSIMGLLAIIVVAYVSEHD
jgi:hypothetical protein